MRALFGHGAALSALALLLCASTQVQAAADDPVPVKGANTDITGLTLETIVRDIHTR